MARIHIIKKAPPGHEGYASIRQPSPPFKLFPENRVQVSDHPSVCGVLPSATPSDSSRPPIPIPLPDYYEEQKQTR